MIAIDTNVLLRYLLWDNKTQAAKADKLINGSTRVLISDVVLAETLWTLKGKKYKFGNCQGNCRLDGLTHAAFSIVGGLGLSHDLSGFRYTTCTGSQ